MIGTPLLNELRDRIIPTEAVGHPNYIELRSYYTKMRGYVRVLEKDQKDRVAEKGLNEVLEKITEIETRMGLK